MISASSLHRVTQCTASAVLPGARSTGASAVRGTSIHAFMRRRLSGISHDEAIAHVDREHRATCTGIDFGAIAADHTKIRSEVSYALNALTGEVRFLGLNMDRRYPDDISHPWIPGTLDMEAVRSDGVPLVEDFKTGQPVDPPAENPQILFAALCLRSTTSASDVEGRIRYVREDGKTWVDRHVFDVFELDAFALDLAEASRRVSDALITPASAVVHAGPWCKYCPAVTSCPQKVGLARTMLPTLQNIGERIHLMTPEQRGEAWVKAKEVESLLEQVISGLRDCARREPTPLPDGKVLTVTESSRTSFVQHDAVSLLRELGATQEQIDGLYRRSTFEVVKAIRVKKEKAA